MIFDYRIDQIYFFFSNIPNYTGFYPSIINPSSAKQSEVFHRSFHTFAHHNQKCPILTSTMRRTFQNTTVSFRCKCLRIQEKLCTGHSSMSIIFVQVWLHSRSVHHHLKGYWIFQKLLCNQKGVWFPFLENLPSCCQEKFPWTSRCYFNLHLSLVTVISTKIAFLSSHSLVLHWWHWMIVFIYRVLSNYSEE